MPKDEKSQKSAATVILLLDKGARRLTTFEAQKLNGLQELLTTLCEQTSPTLESGDLDSLQLKLAIDSPQDSKPLSKCVRITVNTTQPNGKIKGVIFSGDYTYCTLISALLFAQQQEVVRAIITATLESDGSLLAIYQGLNSPLKQKQFVSLVPADHQLHILHAIKHKTKPDELIRVIQHVIDSRTNGTNNQCALVDSYRQALTIAIVFGKSQAITAVQDHSNRSSDHSTQDAIKQAALAVVTDEGILKQVNARNLPAYLALCGFVGTKFNQAQDHAKLKTLLAAIQTNSDEQDRDLNRKQIPALIAGHLGGAYSGDQLAFKRFLRRQEQSHTEDTTSHAHQLLTTHSQLSQDEKQIREAIRLSNYDALSQADLYQPLAFNTTYYEKNLTFALRYALYKGNVEAIAAIAQQSKQENQLLSEACSKALREVASSEYRWVTPSNLSAFLALQRESKSRFNLTADFEMLTIMLNQLKDSKKRWDLAAVSDCLCHYLGAIGCAERADFLAYLETNDDKPYVPPVMRLLKRLTPEQESLARISRLARKVSSSNYHVLTEALNQFAPPKAWLWQLIEGVRQYFRPTPKAKDDYYSALQAVFLAAVKCGNSEAITQLTAQGQRFSFLGGRLSDNRPCWAAQTVVDKAYTDLHATNLDAFVSLCRLANVRFNQPKDFPKLAAAMAAIDRNTQSEKPDMIAFLNHHLGESDTQARQAFLSYLDDNPTVDNAKLAKALYQTLSSDDDQSTVRQITPASSHAAIQSALETAAALRLNVSVGPNHHPPTVTPSPVGKSREKVQAWLDSHSGESSSSVGSAEKSFFNSTQTRPEAVTESANGETPSLTH